VKHGRELQSQAQQLAQEADRERATTEAEHEVHCRRIEELTQCIELADGNIQKALAHDKEECAF
jgi:hypothetical protein